jgi:rod shape determining protein RodA
MAALAICFAAVTGCAVAPGIRMDTERDPVFVPGCADVDLGFAVGRPIDPERDPLGAGYHILQSKIALGSGGVFGKGFMGGTQSHLNFLPEKQTDFIFTMLAEELGLAGGLLLLLLYLLIMAYCFGVAFRSDSHFGRLLAIGVGITFFLYVFINIAMVTGLIPVVGVPLPLISYGGTAMLTLMIGFGLLISCYIHRDITISRHGNSDS